MKRKRLPLFIVLGLAAVFVLSCTQPFSPMSGEDPADRAAVFAPSALKAVVATDKILYHPGETVKMSVILTNGGSRPVTLDFMTSQRFDFVVSSGYVETWKWSAGKVFLPVVGKAIIMPGKSITYRVAEYVAQLPSGGNGSADSTTLGLTGRITSAPAYPGTTQFKVSRYIPL